LLTSRLSATKCCHVVEIVDLLLGEIIGSKVLAENVDIKEVSSLELD